MTTMTTSQSSSEAVGEAPSPPVVPDPVSPVTPSHCLAGHPRQSWPDKRGRDHTVWSIAPVGKRTSRIVDVPINGQPNIYTVTHPRLWRCADCAKEHRRFFAAMMRPSWNGRRNRWDWTAEENARYAELSRFMHFAVPLPRVARGRSGRDQMRHITQEAIAWIVAQRSGGASLSQVAAQVGVSRSEVSRISAQSRRAQQRARQKTGQPW